MRLLPRTTTCNPIAVKMNGGKPYSTGYYDTHIKPVVCCDNEPDLYTTTEIKGFLKVALYEFRCSVCGCCSEQEITPNAAAAGWNEQW